MVQFLHCIKLEEALKKDFSQAADIASALYSPYEVIVDQQTVASLFASTWKLRTVEHKWALLRTSASKGTILRYYQLYQDL